MRKLWKLICSLFADPKAEIERAIELLYFQSESDCLWQMFEPAQGYTGQLDCTAVKYLAGKSSDSFCEQLSFYGFFVHAVATQPQTIRYERLGEVIHEELDDPKAFKLAGFDHFNYSYWIAGRAGDEVVMLFVGATET